eukprot:scaffold332378_cov17-Prasinocladus_malaysianus.AAC.1
MRIRDFGPRVQSTRTSNLARIQAHGKGQPGAVRGYNCGIVLPFVYSYCTKQRCADHRYASFSHANGDSMGCASQRYEHSYPVMGLR